LFAPRRHQLMTQSLMNKVSVMALLTRIFFSLTRSPRRRFLLVALRRVRQSQHFWVNLCLPMKQGQSFELFKFVVDRSGLMSTLE